MINFSRLCNNVCLVSVWLFPRLLNNVLFNDIKLIMDRVQGRFYCNANEKS